MIRKRSYEPATIQIDDVRLRLRIKRLTIDESALFDRLFWRAVLSEADRLVLVRRPGEELERHTGSALTTAALEQARRELAELRARPVTESGPAALEQLAALVDLLKPTDAFVVSDEEIRRRRMLEMSDAERARYQAMRLEDDKAYARFLDETVAQFVRVEPGQVEWEDEDGQVSPVLDGAALARCYGARADVLKRIVNAIREENELSDDQKKALRSRSDSTDSSSERDRTATGASSVPTAAPASDSDSVTTAGATPTEASSSGPTVN